MQLIDVLKNYRLEDEFSDPLPLKIEPIPFSRDFLCEFPTIGSVLRVVIDESIGKHGFDVLHAGTWVTVVNMLCEVHEGLWRGVLTPSSKVHYMSNNDSIVLEQQRSLLLLVVFNFLFYFGQ